MRNLKNVLMVMVLGLVLGLILSSTGVAATIDITSSADTFVNSGGPTTNEGTDSYVWISPGKNGLIQFELSAIPAGQAITSAKLKTYVWYLAGNTATNVYKETDAWTETGATWNTTDGTTAWGGSAGGYGTGMTPTPNGSPLDTITVNAANSSFEWDVTSAVQEWYSNSSTNHGLLLERNQYGGSGFKCYSREHAGGQPVLSVTYAPVPEPATIGLLLTGLGLFSSRKK